MLKHILIVMLQLGACAIAGEAGEKRKMEVVVDQTPRMFGAGEEVQLNVVLKNRGDIKPNTVLRITIADESVIVPVNGEKMKPNEIGITEWEYKTNAEGKAEIKLKALKGATMIALVFVCPELQDAKVVELRIQ